MENPTPDFPPLTPSQLDLLKEIKAEDEKLATLSALNPEVPKINKRIDELCVKALRFAFKSSPKESRRPGFRFVFDSTGEYAEILPEFGVFHPDLPPWFKDYFIEWIRMQRAGSRRYDGRNVLRETGIVGIETGMKGPIDFEDIKRWKLIEQRVLELRGVQKEESEDDDSNLIPAISPALAIESSPYPLGELVEELQNRTRVTLEMLKKVRSKKKGKRTRKNYATWDMVIDTLVEEKLLPRKITRQAFKKSLNERSPDIPWDEI